ncbi:MAG TPA: hypothetical protein VM434_17555 [Beijerinckiaceae bacterium]|nr:hypothetical protein [Beijerinckiaceae bacterium]
MIDHQTIETAAPSQGVAQDAGARPNPEQSPPDEARAPASAPPPPRQAEPPQQEGAGQDDDGFDAASTMVKIREEYDGARSAADVEEIAALYAEDMDRFTRGQREEIAAWHEAAAARFAEKPAQKPAQARQASAGVRQPPAPRTPPAGQESDFSTDPFTMPASFASTEAYRMWFHEATQNARTDDDLGKVVGAYNLSKEMRAELGVSDGTNIDIRGMIQRMVTRIRGGEPSAPAPADTPSVGATEGSPPVGATKESEPAPSAAEPGVPTTIAEYDAWLERLIAGEPDPERLKKAWFESSDWKDTLDPPPTKAQREAWRKRLFDHVKTLRGEG